MNIIPPRPNAPECSVCLEPLIQAGTLNCQGRHKLGYDCTVTFFEMAKKKNDYVKCPLCEDRVTEWAYDREYSQLVQSLAGENADTPEQTELSYSPNNNNNNSGNMANNNNNGINRVNSNNNDDEYVVYSQHERAMSELASAFGGMFSANKIILNNPPTFKNSFVIRTHNSGIKNNNNNNVRRNINTPGQNTQLSGGEEVGSIVTGNLKMMGNSECHGNVDAYSVTLMGNSECYGVITAESVTLMGNSECKGKIQAKLVTLMGNSECHGLIDADTLVIKSNRCSYVNVSDRTKIINSASSSSSVSYGNVYIYH